MTLVLALNLGFGSIDEQRLVRFTSCDLVLCGVNDLLHLATGKSSQVATTLAYGVQHWVGRPLAFVRFLTVRRRLERRRRL